MNPIKWLRKNNKKVMAIIVAFLMVAFVGGSWLSSISRRPSSPKNTIAFYGENKKITVQDFVSAQRDLSLLKRLGADEFLKSMSLPISGGELDIQALLLGELLFGEKQYAGAVSMVLKQAVQRRGYMISDKQINDIYNAQQKHVYWFLLKKEAEQAGILIANDAAKIVLEQLLTQLSRRNPQMNRPGYGILMNALISEFRVSEEEALSIFGELLSVMRYISLICSNEDVTAPQMIFEASVIEEPISVSLVRFDSAVFADSQPEPSVEEIAAQFEKYRGFAGGMVTDENPYGFGYKYDDAVVLDYIAVRLDEIQKKVPVPTEEEKEKFYQKYKDQFVEEIPADPNDPNSYPAQRAMSYAEVAHLVSQQLLKMNVNSQANKIMQDARSLADAGIMELLQETKKPGIEKLKASAVDYNKIAADLTAKYNVKVYAGQTGRLTAGDVRSDENLASLYVRGQGTNLRGVPLMVWLYQIIFAIEEIGSSELGPADVPAPNMYENIGPLRDAAEQITAIVRIVDAKKAFEPESADQTISRKTFDLGLPADPNASDIYSVAENVTKDIKRLAAMKTTAEKAAEFIELAKKDGWDTAVAEFNDLYGGDYSKETGEPNAFTIQDSARLQRMSDKTLEVIAAMSRGKPGAETVVRSRNIERLFVDKLYSLVPQENTTLEDLPAVVEFEPTLSYYVIKDITINRLGQTRYETTKGIRAFSEDLVQAQSVAAVYLNPDNIVKRANFKYDETRTGQNAPVYDDSALPEDEGY